MAISDELKAIYQDAQYDLRLIRTIEISHPSFSDTFYLAENNVDIIGKLENGTEQTFIAHGFTYQLPNVTTKGQSNAKFTIDVTDQQILREFWNFMDNLLTNPNIVPIKLNWREYLSNSTEIQNSILDMELNDIQFIYNKIEATGSMPDIVNRKFPFNRFDELRYEGLKYV